MTAEQTIFFLKGFLSGREPGQPTSDEWSLVSTMILTAESPVKPCGCKDGR